MNQEFSCDTVIQCSLCNRIFKNGSQLKNHKKNLKPCAIIIKPEQSTTKKPNVIVDNTSNDDIKQYIYRTYKYNNDMSKVFNVFSKAYGTMKSFLNRNNGKIMLDLYDKQKNYPDFIITILKYCFNEPNSQCIFYYTYPKSFWNIYFFKYI